MKYRWIHPAWSRRNKAILICVLANDKEKNILLSCILLDVCTWAYYQTVYKSSLISLAIQNTQKDGKLEN